VAYNEEKKCLIPAEFEVLHSHHKYTASISRRLQHAVACDQLTTLGDVAGRKVPCRTELEPRLGTQVRRDRSPVNIASEPILNVGRQERVNRGDRRRRFLCLFPCVCRADRPAGTCRVVGGSPGRD
jgi:hypothetical protein